MKSVSNNLVLNKEKFQIEVKKLLISRSEIESKCGIFLAEM